MFSIIFLDTNVICYYNIYVNNDTTIPPWQGDHHYQYYFYGIFTINTEYIYHQKSETKTQFNGLRFFTLRTHKHSF